MYYRLLPNGRYQFFEKYKTPDGKTHQASVVMPGKAPRYRMEASSKLQDKIRTAAGAHPSEELMTLHDLSELYVAYQKKTIKEQSAINTRMHFNGIEKVLGADTYISDLTAAYINTCFINNSLPASRINEYITRIKAMFRWAYRNDLVSDIAFIQKLTKVKDQEKKDKLRTKFLEKDEALKLLSGMTSEKWRLLSEFQLLSGMRIGECIALRDADVDEYIHVTKTYVQATRSVSTPKTQDSSRDVFVQPELQDCIDRIRAYIKKESAEIGYQSDIFIPSSTGSYILYDIYSKYFRENCERILGRRLSPHALRHSHVALLAAAGYSLEQISRRLGHSDSKITKEVYFHVTQDLQSKDNEQLSKIRLLS